MIEEAPVCLFFFYFSAVIVENSKSPSEFHTSFFSDQEAIQNSYLLKQTIVSRGDKTNTELDIFREHCGFFLFVFVFVLVLP